MVTFLETMNGISHCILQIVVFAADSDLQTVSQCTTFTGDITFKTYVVFHIKFGQSGSAGRAVPVALFLPSRRY
jgi:hypothetical protein